MAKERSAIATIKGYYYQFDYFILQLLKCNNETDSICIEGIEDVDLKTVDENNRRLFIGNEFYATANSKCGIYQTEKKDKCDKLYITDVVSILVKFVV